ncbi:MAG: thermonuclease family protein [Caulobacterales bacterium]|jgi:endonuclease YncB( thermonuclease family)|nr:thermonuclease family protein [Caulobacterales bacterium]
MDFAVSLIFSVLVVLLIVALVFVDRRPARRPRPATPAKHSTVPAAPYVAPYKIKARSSAEMKSLIETLPAVRVLDICDGDTLYVAKGGSKLKVRLDSIDCPEDGQQWGDIATFGLIKLVGGKRTVHLEEHGIDDFGRTLATLYVRHANGRDWLNVNERMVALGHAWVMRAYYDHLPADRQEQLNKLEGWAQSRAVGLWANPNPMPPWQWRKEVWRPPAP